MPAVTSNNPLHLRNKKRAHRRGYSEAHIEMFKEVELEFEMNKGGSVSQHNLAASQSSLYGGAGSSPPRAAKVDSSDSLLSNIHLSQVDVRMETLDKQDISGRTFFVVQFCCLTRFLCNILCISGEVLIWLPLQVTMTRVAWYRKCRRP